jgi:hypothetical protein
MNPDEETFLTRIPRIIANFTDRTFRFALIRVLFCPLEIRVDPCPSVVKTNSAERFRQIAATILLLFHGANAGRAGTNELRWQMITLPVNAGVSHFADVDNDGRADLLVVDSVKKRLLIYRQRVSGFTNVPDQMVPLPPQTAWIAPYDVEAHPGLELLMSTATGLVYYRQNGGVFESDPRTLVQAGQVFTNEDIPSLVSITTNAAIPMISATQAVLYRRNNVFEWKPGPAMNLEARQNNWLGYRNEWTVGANSSRSLYIRQSHRPAPNDADGAKPEANAFKTQERRIEPVYQRADDEKPENDAIGKLIDEMKKTTGRWHQPGMNRVDLDGDGQKDLVLWQIGGEVESRTDVYVFLRDADGKLPERPTQVLHCRGFPIPVGSIHRVSPLGDLKDDGTYELILLEFKSTITSASSVVDMAISRGFDWRLAIRMFKQGAFSRSPDATVAIKAIMPVAALEQWPVFICGDFDGDGHTDFVVQRTSAQWNIFPGTNDPEQRDWFMPKPAISFETPMPGYFEINDLDGDGRSDIVLREPDDPRIFIYLSTLRHNPAEPDGENRVQSQSMKGTMKGGNP